MGSTFISPLEEVAQLLTLAIKMKYLVIALTISMAMGHANGLSCWTCPFTSSGEDLCLTDGAELGESRECNSFQNACETLAIDDETAPLRYNRRCARSTGEDGCTEANIQTPDGNVYPGRICFCTTEDNCNTIV